MKTPKMWGKGSSNNKTKHQKTYCCKIANAFLWCPQKKNSTQLIICGVTSQLYCTMLLRSVSVVVILIINCWDPFGCCIPLKSTRFVSLSSSIAWRFFSISASLLANASVFSAFLMQPRSYFAITFRASHWFSFRHHCNLISRLNFLRYLIPVAWLLIWIMQYTKVETNLQFTFAFAFIFRSSSKPFFTIVFICSSTYFHSS